MDIQTLEATARQVRRDIITMTAAAGAGHPGGSLSSTEAMVALYFDVMNIDPAKPDDPDRDRFVLSKGHAAPVLYAALAEKGFFDKEWLKDKDDNLTGADYEEGQILILNFKMIDPVFKGQNKEELSSSEGRIIVQQLTSQALNEYFILHEKEIKIIVDKALRARNVREAAKKAREAARELNGEDKKKKLKKIDSKLADCSSKNRMECELYITEGDSASGNLKTARDNKTQAVLPVRGKLLNTQTASISEIKSNKEIMSMIQAFGLKVDPKTLKLTYEKEDLRYGKIIIMSDADVDGAHIKNLFYTFIWNFCPDLIREGYIYAGMPPLYKITEGKDSYVYLKDDKALEEYREAHKGKKYTVNRMKGYERVWSLVTFPLIGGVA